MSESEERPINNGGDGADRHRAWELPAELKSLEARLAALSPRDDRLDRERLLFLAGRASAEASLEVLGLSVRQPPERLWPAAFAAMTAIAATLLIMLVTRPVVTEPLAGHVADAAERPPVTRPSIAKPMGFNTIVLSTGDARRHDIEQLLSAVSLAANGDTAKPIVKERQRATLTPAAWRQIIDSADPRRPQPDDASDTDI